MNEMSWNLQQNFDFQLKNLESFSIKPTAKYLSLSLSLKKEMNQFIVFTFEGAPILVLFSLFFPTSSFLEGLSKIF